MLLYQLRIAVKSLLRNPVLSTLLVTGIALGIAVSTAFVTIYYLLSGDPIPRKSEQLFYVEIDNWDPASPWDDDRPELPPNQISYRDARALLESDIPTFQTANFKTAVVVQPENEEEKPFREVARACFSDFFPMFDAPFRYGGGWGPGVDAAAEQVVVLSDAMNRRLFGDENSVGRTVRLSNRTFTVVGVLDAWRPSLLFYDVNNNPFDEPEAIYMPFNLVEPLELRTTGNTSNWKFYPGNDFRDFLESESIWLQFWVQLDDARQRDAYAGFLDSYVLEQQRIGRLTRPVNNRLLDVMGYLEQEEVLPDEATSMLIISLLFLVVCSVNLIGILLGKFLARAPEIGVRRALGASRFTIFAQHIVECEVVGVLGGAFGLLLSAGVLQLINRLFENQLHFALDLNMVLAGLVLALGAGLIAGLYPAWRICRVAPALYLKER